MSVYVLLVILIFVAYYGTNGKKNKKQFLTFAFIMLFILMGFRDCNRIGVDSQGGYLQQFHTQRRNPYIFALINGGLPLVMKTVSTLGLGYQVFLMVEAAFVCYSYYWLIKKYSVNQFITVMWFMGMLFYTFMFSALKQAFAMAILCYAFDAMMQRKPVRFICLVLLAAFFHFPALVFMPAYWIAKMPIGKSFFALLLCIMVIVFIFREKILTFMSGLYYSGETTYSDAKFMGTKVVLMLLILVVGMLIRTPDSKNDRMYSACYAFMGVAAVFQTFCYYNNIFERLADYYYQYSILFMPMLINYDRGTKTGLSQNTRKQISGLLSIVIVVFCVWRFLDHTLSGSNFLSPFYFFWD